MVESTASGGASNSLVDLDENTVLELRAHHLYEWRPSGDDTYHIYPATVFSGENCSGNSSEIILDTNWDGISTGRYYRDVESKLTIGQNI
jgi:hypothetical protein